MNRIIKLSAIIMFLFFITGCSDSRLKKSYNLMKISNIESYILDLKVYGKNIDDNYRISNYKNEQLKVVYFTLENKTLTNYVKYVEDNKYYEMVGSDFVASETKPKYTDTNVFLTGLLKAKKVQVSDKQSTYKIYNVVFDKNFFNDLLKSINIDVAVDEDISGEIHLDKDSRVNRIIYKSDEITINANYFGYGLVTKTKFK